MDFSLFCRKANNVPMQQPQSWGVEFKDGGVVYSRKDVFDTDDVGELSYYQLVYNVLKTEGSSDRNNLKERIRELKPRDARGREIPTDRSERNVESAVSKQKKDGNVTESDGVLTLVTQSSEGGDSWQSM